MDGSTFLATILGAIVLALGVLFGRERQLRGNAEARSVLSERRRQIREAVDRKRSTEAKARAKALAEIKARQDAEAATLEAGKDEIKAATMEALADLWNNGQGGDGEP